jgi:hypothetical protein
VAVTGFTLIVPYYRNPEMLRRQAVAWAGYPAGIRVILVDDGSPEPAHEVLPNGCRAALYRIETDIPWNRNGARNLGAQVAETDWILQTDIDHLLPVPSAIWLAEHFTADPACWYRFARFRAGRADATRRKDAIPDDAVFGPVKPHVDSYLCTRALYWRMGGYDEDYSGHLGGSAPFLAALAAVAPCELLEDAPLWVHTRHSIADASDLTLSRDRKPYEDLRAHKRSQGDLLPTDHLRFPWHQVR